MVTTFGSVGYLACTLAVHIDFGRKGFAIRGKAEEGCISLSQELEF